MATIIPKISGPTNANSVIYGLNLNVNYSSEPSKLTLNYVSSNGSYTTPSLNQSSTVTFGNFKFNGKIWGSNLKESADEKTLDIELVDNSVILDQIYVILWKRGLFNINGVQQTVTKKFDLSDEKILIPVTKDPNTGYPYTVYEETALGIQSVTRKSKKISSTGYSIRGNVIIIGTEKFADSDCDIPDTYYYFDDLKSAISALNININSAPLDRFLKGTNEGTLRSVLNSWCSDLGYDFYWDYSNDSINFYNVARGITTNLPVSNTSSKIISKERSQSMEGTYIQYGSAYTIRPRQPLKSLSYSNERTSLKTVKPIPIGYLLKRNGTDLGKFSDTGRSGYGSGRSLSNFIESAFLGYVSRSLRDFHAIHKKHWEILGYDGAQKQLAKENTINFLNANGFRNLISELQEKDGEKLPNYQIFLNNYDESLGDRWHEMEQELLQSLGKYYRIADTAGTFFYCDDKQTVEINTSVDPEGETITFKDESTLKKIFTRGGQIDTDQATALEKLNYDEASSQVSKCAPTHILLKENGLGAKLVTENLITKEDASKYGYLIIMPDYAKIINPLLNLSVTSTVGFNDAETTWYEQKQDNLESARKNCQYEDRIENSQCSPAEEEARKKALKALNVPTGDEKNRDNFISGLTAKSAWKATIKLKTGSVTIAAPSHAGYQTVTKRTIQVNKIAKEELEFTSFNSNIPTNFNGGVAEIRVINENATDSLEDYWGKKRVDPTEIPLPPPVNASTPHQTIKYVFAGEPEGITLSPSNGLSSLDVSLSSDGFTTSATFSTRPPTQSKSENILRIVNSQLNRASFNAS